MSLLTAVEKTTGRGPVAARSSMVRTTVLACSTVVMKGTVIRSKLLAGNWVNSVLPSVSAVMPVLSERK
ncbi:hypothetical protein D9M72_620820 [compost metagenome]